MVLPIKIISTGRSLSCTEHDQNIDAVLDRANHTGIQNCSTIEPTSFYKCVEATPSVRDLLDKSTNLGNRLGSIEDALAGGGSIAQDLQTLKTELLDQIDQIEIVVSAHNNRLVNLETKTAGFDSSIISISAELNFKTDGLQAQITSNDLDITNLQNKTVNIDSSIANTKSQIGNETAARIAAVQSLTVSLDNEISNRNVDRSNLTSAINAEQSSRTAADSAINNLINNNRNSIEASLLNESHLRASNEGSLQAQINSLSSSLSNVVPTGVILMYSATSVPPGYELCNGSILSRSAYPALFSIIGTAYGTTAANNFMTPNFNDRLPLGHPNANAGTFPGVSAGANSLILSEANMPAHSHTTAIGNHAHQVNTTHSHTLYVRPHTHPGGGGGMHVHSLNPYRAYNEGNGTRGNGAELTNVPGGTNSHPNTASADAGGTAIGLGASGIYPLNDSSGLNKTDVGGGLFQTTDSTYGTIASNVKGSSTSIDLRSAYLTVKYIIKT